MSDVLIVISSEMYGALRELGYFKHMPIWGTGKPGETLKDFLNKHLSEMAYDEFCHIITEVVEVKLKTRCPYPHHEHDKK